MKCKHQHYKQGGYMTSYNALKAFHAGEIYYMGKIIEKCDKCGENIRWARVVRVMTKAEYKAQQGFW